MDKTQQEQEEQRQQQEQQQQQQLLLQHQVQETMEEQQQLLQHQVQEQPEQQQHPLELLQQQVQEWVQRQQQQGRPVQYELLRRQVQERLEQQQQLGRAEQQELLQCQVVGRPEQPEQQELLQRHVQEQQQQQQQQQQLGRTEQQELLRRQVVGRPEQQELLQRHVQEQQQQQHQVQEQPEQLQQQQQQQHQQQHQQQQLLYLQVQQLPEQQQQPEQHHLHQLLDEVQVRQRRRWLRQQQRRLRRQQQQEQQQQSPPLPAPVPLPFPVQPTSAVPSYQLEQQLLDDLLEVVCPQMDWSLECRNVLVLGCGTGDITAQVLFPRLPRDVAIIAADSRDAMLEQASTRFGRPGLYFVHTDIADPDIETSAVWHLGPYSKVFSFFYLHSIMDQNLALANIHKLMCPGGEALLVLVIHTAVDALYQALARSSLWELYVEDYRHFVTPYQFLDDPKEVLEGYLEDAGFHIKCCECRDAFLASDNIDIITEGVKTTNLSHDRLPDELRELYLRECVAEVFTNGKLMSETDPAEGRCYHYKYTALVAHVVKP